MFDDDSQSPFVLHAVPESLDQLPAKADEGRGDLACLIYIGREEKPVEVLALTAGYRRVPRLPWMKPASLSSEKACRPGDSCKSIMFLPTYPSGSMRNKLS